MWHSGRMHITPLRELPSDCLGNWSAAARFDDPAPLRVLLVDDCQVNQFLGAALLSTWGIEPQMASNGVEALERVIEGTFDIVLMDLEMPVMNGLNATRSIRMFERTYRPGRGVPIVAYTTSIGNCNAGIVGPGGFSAVLRKPCTIDELRACLSRWCPDTFDSTPVM